ncbi:MAG: endonuclease/exonuclease/phosphatase family protein [Deltaproteobacteria bacterium]|nr:endonuclease/exonuclease/phosphatase family protein [Deltaproteobacteria bacterium]
MRLISWNCSRAFRKKAARLIELKPDVIVVPECENPAVCKSRGWLDGCTAWKWVGADNNRGLGIFFYHEVEIQDCCWFDPEIKLIKPYTVRDKHTEYVIIPVYANNRYDDDRSMRKFRYIGQVWKFLEKYQDRLSDSETLMVGDFNSNTIWDKPRRRWNHSHIVNILRENKMESLYHYHNNIEQGKEYEKTLYFRKKQNNGYHIDYIFGSPRFRDALISFTIGNYEDWIDLSDHCPIICDFDSTRLRSRG